MKFEKVLRDELETLQRDARKAAMALGFSGWRSASKRIEDEITFWVETQSSEHRAEGYEAAAATMYMGEHFFPSAVAKRGAVPRCFGIRPYSSIFS